MVIFYNAKLSFYNDNLESSTTNLIYINRGK